MTDFDEPKDPGWLLAIDWARLNKLERAYKDGGDDALEGACRDLMNNDLQQFARIACAYLPNHMPQRIKDALEDALAGFTQRVRPNVVLFLANSINSWRVKPSDCGEHRQAAGATSQ